MPFQLSAIALQLGAGALAFTLGAGPTGESQVRKPQRTSYAEKFASHKDAKDISGRIANEFRGDAPRPEVLHELVSMLPLPKKISEREVVYALMSAHSDLDVGQRARIARHIERAGPHPALRAAMVAYGPGNRPETRGKGRHHGHAKAKGKPGSSDPRDPDGGSDARPDTKRKKHEKEQAKRPKRGPKDQMSSPSRFDHASDYDAQTGASESGPGRLHNKKQWKPQRPRPQTPGSVEAPSIDGDDGPRDKAAKRIGKRAKRRGKQA
jgi:hypothetical protein